MIRLKEELLAARAANALIVWVNNDPWIGDRHDDATQGNGWWAYAAERNEIADFIHLNGIATKLVQLSAGNMLAFDSGANNKYDSSTDRYTGVQKYGKAGKPIPFCGTE